MYHKYQYIKHVLIPLPIVAQHGNGMHRIDTSRGCFQMAQTTESYKVTGTLASKQCGMPSL